MPLGSSVRVHRGGGNRDQVPRGDPTPRNRLARSESPRGGSHCEFRFGSRLRGLPQFPIILPSLPVQGLIQRPPLAPPDRGAHSAGPREGGNPAAFHGSAIPSLKLLGRAGGAGSGWFDITARSGPAPAASSRIAFHQRNNRDPGWLLLLFCSLLWNRWRSPVGGCPGGGFGGSSRCGREVTIERGSGFLPLDWGTDSDR